VLTSESLNTICGARLHFKCENFQKVGAFKFRGALHAVLKLTDEEAEHGVATHSSGNHAAALALAAKMRAIPAYIVMPETAPTVKQEAVRGYGARISFCRPTLEAREEAIDQVIQQTGAVFIHPYDNEKVICGQGTAALEMLEQMPPPDVVVAPVGGGGLLSGTAIAVGHLCPTARVIGAEPQSADDARRSFHSNTLVPSVNPQTIADGLLTSLSPRTFGIIKQQVADILTATEEGIVEAMRLIWERMKIVVEPSAAVPLAVVIEHPGAFQEKTVGLILSGGNVDLGRLPFQTR
jgi:threonine dehydratase